MAFDNFLSLHATGHVHCTAVSFCGDLAAFLLSFLAQRSRHRSISLVDALSNSPCIMAHLLQTYETVLGDTANSVVSVRCATLEELNYLCQLEWVTSDKEISQEG